VQQRRFEDWSLYIDVPKLWVASPRSEQDVVTICNWARGANHRVRALGHSHNWSPLVVPGDTHASAPVVLVDTSRLVGSPTFQMVDGVPTATFGVGTTVEAATLFLQSLDNGGTGGAPGYTFQNMTAPGALSLGGVLAIGAHGTGVPCGAAEPHLNGCMSNLVLSYKAVVTDPNAPAPAAYEVRRFDRADPDAPAFLVHLGRAFLTEVTLRVVPNYYLQVTNWYPDAEVLFQEPQAGVVAPPQALATLLDRYGRVEVIWFPFTTAPWVKTWELKPDRIEPQVAGPYNYPWANRISKFESQLIKGGLFVAPHLTPAFGALQVDVAKREAPEGATMNGTARDLLLYVEDTTLRVTACGYALQIPRSRVQEVVRSFYVQYTAMLESYRQAGRFPVNGPVELRFTTIDRQDDLGVPGAAPPAIAATHSVDPADAELDTVFWVDSLTLPGTSGSGEFFTELESWMIATWGGGPTNGLRPEWSKGWAYTPTGGPWTDADKIASTIPATYDQPAVDPWTFEWARATLARYDAHNLFTNPFLDLLFTDGRADG
jgi:FAD/FMN-containing dehydrogenase